MEQALFLSFPGVLGQLPCVTGRVAGVGNKKLAVVHHITVGPDDCQLPWDCLHPRRIKGAVVTGFEYLKAELKDVFAMADVIISRAGANAICELLALKKPNLLIPLPAGQSRGDQLLNAASFESQGYSMVIQEENLTPELLVEKVQELYFTRQIYIDAMNSSMQMSSISSIMKLIQEAVG